MSSAPSLWPAILANLSILRKGTRDIAIYLAGKTDMMLADEFYALMDVVDRDAAFTISRLASSQMIEQAWEALAMEASTGGTLNGFWNTLDAFYDTRGWTTELGPAHVENIFRTNMAKAMNAGRYQHQMDVRAEYPLWMFDAYDEAYDPETGKGTCPLCAMLDRRVYRWDHPFWSSYYPPLHFQCRCKVLQMDAQLMSTIPGAALYADMPSTVDADGVIRLPHKGFGAPPPSSLTNEELIARLARAIARMERNAA